MVPAENSYLKVFLGHYILQFSAVVMPVKWEAKIEITYYLYS